MTHSVICCWTCSLKQHYVGKKGRNQLFYVDNNNSIWTLQDVGPTQSPNDAPQHLKGRKAPGTVPKTNARFFYYEAGCRWLRSPNLKKGLLIKHEEHETMPVMDVTATLQLSSEFKTNTDHLKDFREMDRLLLKHLLSVCLNFFF